MSEEKCKFYKKQFLSKYCELFKQPCYGKHCNFIKEFTRLNELEQQLQKAKEENEYRDNMLCEQIEIWRSNCDVWMNQSNKFEQQNKQMSVAINNIKNLCNEDWEDMTVDKFQNQLLQALKGVEQMKETYCQLQCEKCKSGLIPIYNEKDRKFKLYCSSCDYTWNIPITIQLTDGIELYKD